jgi:hypothetical protein
MTEKFIKADIFEIDAEKLAHELRNALLSFREARDALTSANPDMEEARVFFSSAEQRLLNLIEKVTGIRE